MIKSNKHHLTLKRFAVHFFHPILHHQPLIATTTTMAFLDRSPAFLVFVCCLLSTLVHSLTLNPDDPTSIKSTARTIIDGILALYTNGAPGTPAVDVGLWPYPPYYWWQSGATWAGLVDYVSYTGDISLVPSIHTGLLAQRGPDSNYIVPEHRFDTGNDDQAFWGLGIMSALENRFPEPPTGNPSWLSMLTALVDNQTARWDATSCAGGLKWQIYPENDYGYNYKNAVSNGAYFQLTARLARYTGNPTYIIFAQRTWDWCERIGLIGPHFEVHDGSDDKLNCTELDHTRWSYNVALFLYGAASLWSHTGDEVWKARVDGLVEAASVFFSPYANATGVMFEAACETHGTCNVDQFSFKAYMARFLAKTAVLAPWTRDRIVPWLRASAVAAAKACSGGLTGQECGHKWYLDGNGFDGTSGLGQQQSAMETVTSLLASEVWPYSPFWAEKWDVSSKTWVDQQAAASEDTESEAVAWVEKRHVGDHATLTVPLPNASPLASAAGAAGSVVAGAAESAGGAVVGAAGSVAAAVGSAASKIESAASSAAGSFANSLETQLSAAGRMAANAVLLVVVVMIGAVVVLN
jgi:mannan endo-1,6-alpha-mannosidase